MMLIFVAMENQLQQPRDLSEFHNGLVRSYGSHAVPLLANGVS